MSLSTSWADAGHLAIAVALTYALGFERDLRGAPTGDRVFALIGAGSGAVGIIAAHGAPNALAGAITGVGFIGGGLVFRQTLGQNQVLMGITTAAAIFAAATIGAAAGEGRVLVATVATALSLLVLEIRHSKVLNLLDGRRYADKFKQDSQDPHLTTTRSRPLPTRRGCRSARVSSDSDDLTEMACAGPGGRSGGVTSPIRAVRSVRRCMQ